MNGEQPTIDEIDEFHKAKLDGARETGGYKLDKGKLPLQLLSTEALNRITEVMQFGAKKYAPNAWRDGMHWSRLIGAALRHLTAFNDGEDLDEESGLSHLAHLACCTMFLLEYEKTHPDKDDRYNSFDEEVKRLVAQGSDTHGEEERHDVSDRFGNIHFGIADGPVR